jgi:hypothetical protein
MPSLTMCAGARWVPAFLWLAMRWCITIAVMISEESATGFIRMLVNSIRAI